MIAWNYKVTKPYAWIIRDFMRLQGITRTSWESNWHITKELKIFFKISRIRKCLNSQNIQIRPNLDQKISKNKRL